MRQVFNWSRNCPSKPTVSEVFIAAPNAYAKFNKDITKIELINSLYQYNTIADLENKRYMLRTALLTVLISIPVFIMMYNFFIGVWN